MNFIDLHAHSTYSSLDAFGTPLQMAKRAKEIGRTALSLTDHGSVSGFVQLNKACKENNMKPIFGCELYMVESLFNMFELKERKKYHITVLAKNLEGYRSLLKLVSLSYSKGFYYKPSIDKEMLFRHQQGLIVLSGCWSGFLQQILKDKDKKGAQKIAAEFQEVFGDRYFLETQHFPLFKDTINGLAYISDVLKIPIVLTCDPHYLKEKQAVLQEILHAIRDRREFDVNQIIYGAHQWPADELFEAVTQLMPQGEWQKWFENTCAVADLCNLEIPTGSTPKYPMDDKNQTANSLMIDWCKKGIIHRNLRGLPAEQKKIYQSRFEKETDLIAKKNYADYFLIVADTINWAKNKGILVGPARGSSAGSLVCYLLGITEIDPLKHDLVFERFIDETRFDLPDIDIDFEDERRNEVKQYMVQKYGEDKVCSVVTFAAFKGRNSLDEIGKVFKIPPGAVNAVKKYLVPRSGVDMRANLTIQDAFEMSPEAQKVKENYPKIGYAALFEGQLRHMSQHAAGVIVGDRPLEEIIALYEKKNGNEKITLSSVEMKDASELGLVKIDILGITELSILRKIAELIGWKVGDYYNISLIDEETMKGFKEIDVEGIFQFEGDSTKSILRQIPNLNAFEQLVACVTLSKPGPAHSGGTSKYITRARGGNAEGLDWHPILKEITNNTYGQIIYQEQVLRIVKEIGQLTFSDANKIRMAMAKSQGENVFNSFFGSFKNGALKNGLTEKQAIQVWEETKTMGRWAFNRSHAVSYAMLAWWSMYMKRHFPLEFYLARLLKEADKDKRFRLLMEIQKRGIKVLSPKIGKSKAEWSIENKGLRAGLSEIKGIGAVTSAKISVVKNKEELSKIKGIGKKTIETLEQLGIFNEDENIDFFNLKRFDILDKIAPDRQKLVDIRDWDKAYPIKVAGIFMEMNYKDIFEERRSRGQPTDNIKNPQIKKYAMLLLEDETDRCLVNVDRYVFDRIGQKVWDAYNNGSIVVVEGNKVGGWRMVRAQEINVFENAI